MESQPIAEETARIAAEKGVLPFLRIDPPEAGPPSELSKWSISNLPEGGGGTGASMLFGSNPTSIFDISGELIYRDFTAQLNDGSELRVRTAASTAFVPSVLSLGIGTPLQISDRLIAAEEVAKRKGLAPVWNDIRAVCYAYPKLGILVGDTGDKLFIIDLGDFTLIPVIPDKMLPVDSLGIASPSSFFSDISVACSAERRLAEQNFLQGVEAGDPADLQASIARLRSESTELTLTNFVLSGQESSSYCAVATAQMILRYHGYDRTQDEIASAMGTDASGTNNQQQIRGYTGITDAKFTAELDTTASFSEAKREIAEGRPLKSGVPRHARACAGWKEDGDGLVSIYIYDPWPPGQGAIYWESWDAMAHTNHLYIKRSLLT